MRVRGGLNILSGFDARFRWFFLGRTVSLLGSALTPVALAFAVLAHHPAHDLGIVLSANIIPLIFFILVGGGLADRYRRDLVLRVSNLAAGITQALVAAAVLTDQPLSILVVLVFVSGAADAFTMPALRGILPDLVSKDRVKIANSHLSAAKNASKIVGPSLAGVLVVTVGGGWAIAFDAGTFLLAALLMLPVTVETSRRSDKTTSLLDELVVGWHAFSSMPWVWSITIVFSITNIIQMGVWQVLGPVIAKSSFGAGGWGAILSVRAVGLLVASVLISRSRVRRDLITCLIAMSICGLPLFLLGVTRSVVIIGAGAFIGGAAATVSGVLWDSSLQSRIPRDRLSRVSAYDDFGAYVGIPFGQLLVFPLAAVVDQRNVALYGGLVFCAVSLVPILLSSVRQAQGNEGSHVTAD